VGRALARHLLERAARVRERFDVDLHLTWVVDTTAAVFSPEGVDIEALLELKARGGRLADAPDARPPAPPDTIRETGVEGLVIAFPTDFERGEPGLTVSRKALDCELDVILADK